MGVTISYKFSQEKHAVKEMLDWTEKGAMFLKDECSEKENIKIDIIRYSDYHLRIDIGECESLVFNFQSVKSILSKEDWSYPYAVLTDDGRKELDEGYEIEKYPKNELYYCAGFCKTQFCENILEHKWVADLIKVVAGRCHYVEVNDEGDYYHTGKLEDAKGSIVECGNLIGSVTGILSDLGYKKENIKSYKTKIK